jgi:hypothetical protein
MVRSLSGAEMNLTFAITSIVKTIWIRLFLIVHLLGFVTIAFSNDDDSGFNLFSEDSVASEKITHYQRLGYVMLPKFRSDGTLKAGKYFAIDDFVVQKGNVLTISDSTSIFFEPGTNLTVEGCLITKGSRANRVVLSNIPAFQLALQRTDTLWNGLTLGNGGTVKLNETDIRNARNGIVVANGNDSLSLECINFSGIRFDRVRVEKSVKILPDTACIDYYFNHKSFKETIPITPVMNRTVHRLRTAALCGTILFGAASLSSYFISRSYYNKATNSTSLVKEPEFEKTSNLALTACAVSGGACALSALTYLFTFKINIKGAASK